VVVGLWICVEEEAEDDCGIRTGGEAMDGVEVEVATAATLDEAFTNEGDDDATTTTGLEEALVLIAWL